MFRDIKILLSLAAVVAVASMVGFVLLKTPSHDRNWKTEHARLPVAEFEDEWVTVRNVRNFSYNPDGRIREAKYFDRTYDLGKVTELWYGISHFYGYGLAHTFLSFGFADGARLVLSIEARQEIGETYRPLTGLFRNYELIFVIADERDVIGVRTHVRGERVYLYRIKANLEYIRRFLRIMLDRVMDLLPFIEDMAEVYSWADLVVCRAGALTVAELCAAGVPALFVPYPAAVDDHQTANAGPMFDAGAAAIIQETQLTPEVLASLLREWLQSRASLMHRAEKARALAQPDSLRRITELCLEQAGVAA